MLIELELSQFSTSNGTNDLDTKETATIPQRRYVAIPSKWKTGIL
jgi:hypothetical protein